MDAADIDLRKGDVSTGSSLGGLPGRKFRAYQEFNREAARLA